MYDYEHYRDNEPILNTILTEHTQHLHIYHGAPNDTVYTNALIMYNGRNVPLQHILEWTISTTSRICPSL